MLPACCAKRREVNNFLDSMETGRRIDSVGMATPGPDRVFLSMDDLLATAAPEIILAPNTRCCARFDVMRSSEFCAQKHIPYKFTEYGGRPHLLTMGTLHEYIVVAHRSPGKDGS